MKGSGSLEARQTIPGDNIRKCPSLPFSRYVAALSSNNEIPLIIPPSMPPTVSRIIFIGESRCYKFSPFHRDKSHGR